jgi:aryl-alcohol dehydrogenase-like predicted oxidoreductase
VLSWAWPVRSAVARRLMGRRRVYRWLVGGARRCPSLPPWATAPVGARADVRSVLGRARQSEASEGRERDVRYVLLGATGVRVSVICLGTAFFGIAPREVDAPGLVARALELGINFVDTANSYGNQTRFDRAGIPLASDRPSSEELVGRGLRGRRHEVVVATKVQEQVGDGPNDGGPAGGGLTRRHIIAQCERSLRRLGTDYVDVYYAHHPDPTTPLEQTLRAFDDLVRQGKVRYPALSNYPAWELTRAMWTCDRLGLNPPVAMEMPYNLLERRIEQDVIPACRAFGVAITAYSALGEGLLTGRFTPAGPAVAADEPPPVRHSPGHTFPESKLRAAEKLSALAREWGLPPAHLALAWLWGRPAVASAIVGPETVTQLEALAPAADLTLDDGQRAALDALSQAAGPTG